MRNRSQFIQIRAITCLFVLGLILLCDRVNAQDLNGVKIQVAADALTYLKFNGEIKRFEFGGAKDDYTGQVVESDQLRIKTLNPDPTPTNLVVSEGGRTHIFIIQVMKKIDINNFKAYYDFSDLKALKKLANSQAAEPAKDITAPEEKPLIIAATAGNDNTTSKTDVPDKKARKQAEKEQREQEKARKEKEEQDRKDKEETDRKIAQAATDKADAQQRQDAAAKEQARLKQEAAAKAKEDAAEQKRMKAEQAQRDKDAAAAKAREQQSAKEKQKEEALAKQQEAAAEKQRRKEEAELQSREEQRKKDIAAAKEKDRQAAIAKADAQRAKEEDDRRKVEQARRDQKAKDDAIAAAKEKQRLAEEAREAAAEKERMKQEEIARKKQEAIEKERIRREEAIKQQQIAMEKEKARQAEAERQAAIAKEQKIAAEKARKEEQARRDEEARKLAEIRAKERADALIKNPYWRTEWHKKYPQINFGEGPVGQLYAGEYFVPRDTMYNSNAANMLIAQHETLKKNYEAEKDGVQLKIVNIGFRGVNVYFQLQITNNSDNDFLVGKMQLTWWKKVDGTGLFLNPAYVTDFPVISPGKDATIIFGCHGVNAKDKDDFAFTMNERITNAELQILFPANLYNKQMLLQKKREQ